MFKKEIQGLGITGELSTNYSLENSLKQNSSDSKKELLEASRTAHEITPLNGILVVTSPFYSAIGPRLRDLLKLLTPFADTTYLLTGKLKDHVSENDSNVKHLIMDNNYLKRIRKKRNLMNRSISYAVSQLIMAKNLFEMRQQVKAVLFYQSEMAVPALVGRLIRKKILVYVGGSGFRTLQAGGLQSKLLSLPKFIEEVIAMSVAHKVITVTRSIPMPMLQSKKVLVAPTRLFDREFFQGYRRKKKLDNKEPVIGFVGMLSPVKGIEELVDAFRLVTALIPNSRLLIVGDGLLREKVEAKISKYSMRNNVWITGWVEDVETYLNEMTLLVIPSKTEGLPNVLFEAIACDTPVLAMPVGAIPDIIKEGETGFLLKSNDPKHIANRIIELLGKPELLEKVSVNAYRYVRENFSCKKTLEAWRRIFSELGLL